ncbi:MAG TPA: tRNA pseudouridine(55) synthase TruB [Isosphaeraceae bacterium]|nr:tRNA pseudouridine(55) synthase TruB [Isosphaeraceae bacterium]
MDGILVVNKPPGMTSRAVVDRVAAMMPGTKVGHAGTLDPLASGVLVVCAGPSTRLVEVVQQLPKSYRTGIRLGARSDTLDAEGRIEPEANPPVPSRGAVDQAVGLLVGEVVQVPPAYSAVKVQGRRAYDLARAGRTVELTGRRVRIDRIAVLRYNWPHLELEIDCGSGTYIRSIARDLGEALGCGGLVETLTRSRIGPFTIDQAVDLVELSTESLPRSLRSPLDALADWPRLALDPGQVAAITAGQRLGSGAFGPAGIPQGWVALLGPDGRLVALAESNPSQGWIQPRKVFGG